MPESLPSSPSVVVALCITSTHTPSPPTKKSAQSSVTPVKSIYPLHTKYKHSHFLWPKKKKSTQFSQHSTSEYAVLITVTPKTIMMITRKKRRYFFKSASTRKAEYVFHREMKTEQPEQSQQNAFSGVFLSTQLSIMPNNLVPKGDSWALREVAPFVLPHTHSGGAEGTPPKPTLPFSSAPSSPSFLVSPSLLHVLWVRQRTSNREQIN